MSVMAGVYKWRINFLGKRWESSGDHRPRTVLQVNDIKRTKRLNIDSSLAYLAAVQYPVYKKQLTTECICMVPKPIRLQTSE